MRNIRLIAEIVLFALIGGVYVGSSTDLLKKASIDHDPVEKIDDSTIRIYKDALENIKISRISIMDFPEQLYLMGKIGITEDRTTVIPSRVTGRIENIYFASGEMVTKGQLLATLFSPDFVAAKEEFVQALKTSKRPTGRSDDFSDLAHLARKKLATLGLTEKDIDAIAEASSDPSKNSDSNPNSKSSPFLNLRAPRNGYIVAKGAVLGNLVNVGDTLFTIGNMDKVWFTGDLYPEDLPKVHKGQEVLVAVRESDKPLKGQVSFISPMVDPVSRSIKIRALVENPHGELKADMYVQGSVTLSERKALLVPTKAIVHSTNGNIIFKRISKLNTETNLNSIDFKRVVVQTGPEQNGMTSIVQGIEDGDEVVADGAWLLDNALNSSESAK